MFFCCTHRKHFPILFFKSCLDDRHDTRLVCKHEDRKSQNLGLGKSRAPCSLEPRRRRLRKTIGSGDENVLDRGEVKSTEFQSLAALFSKSRFKRTTPKIAPHIIVPRMLGNARTKGLVLLLSYQIFVCAIMDQSAPVSIQRQQTRLARSILCYKWNAASVFLYKQFYK